MKWPVFAGSLSCIVAIVSSAIAGPPVYSPAQIYSFDRQAIHRDFERQEDALRYNYKSVREQEEAAWRNARKSAPPQARKYINQQYAQRKKELARSYVAQRKSLDQIEDRTQDAVRDNYRSSLQYRAYPPTNYLPVYPAPRVVPAPSAPLVQPPYYEELPPPVIGPLPGGRDI